MTAQFKLESLTGLIEKVARRGRLTQLLGKDNVVPKSIEDFLKTSSEQPTQTAGEPSSAHSTASVPSAKASSTGTPSARSNVIGGILGALGRISAVPFVELVRENIGSNVLVTTNREIVEGIVTEVGAGYAVLTEAEGATVVVNFRNTLAFQPSNPAEVEAE
ncbi:hypothetical protein A8L34_17045 [Bacillus sp. FJAT-27264]|uniref:hypothetical protein n=1 Tax=Paenibacillus sp. (strain DSM 101736 / FJAT-27264) TaxID=1850362 RepID=UPI0008080519|nr:hypothetical protein [Bacillus sp. FJAT-27264]OBZ12017.1 hypothetical protein A8L34_17045 [Bacillus sp. FJAT-27264]